MPLYLYSGLLLIGLFILSLFSVSGWGSYERSKYISDPQVGDVYLMKASQRVLTGYRFARVTRITGDSVIAIGNSIMYLTATSEFDSQDTFDNEQQVVLSKSALKQMYQTDSIENVFRDYGNSTGFNRIK